MKVYNVETLAFSSRDKYYGRRVKPRELPDALSLFFHDGVRLRIELISVFLTKLYELLDIFQTDELAEYRFWSSSLLLIYEGEQSPGSLTKEGIPRIDLKIIDFAHSVHNRECADDQRGVDQGMVRGLISLIECLGNISLDSSNCNARNSLKTPQGWRQGSATPQSNTRARTTSNTPARSLDSLAQSRSLSDFPPLSASFGGFGSNDSLAGSPNLTTFSSSPHGRSILQSDAVYNAASQAPSDILGSLSASGCSAENGVT